MFKSKTKIKTTIFYFMKRHQIEMDGLKLTIDQNLNIFFMEPQFCWIEKDFSSWF